MEKERVETKEINSNSSIENFKQCFLSQAQKKLSSKESQKLWEQITNNNAYTFNKAHAVAYSYLSYYFAFLKASCFSSLIVFFLNGCLNSSEKTLTYLQEAFFFGFTIQKPDINFSELKWTQINWTKKGQTIDQKILIMGFANLKEFSAEFFETIIAERGKKGKFKDWEDLLARTKNQWEKVSLDTFHNWIAIGLFNSLGVDADYLLEHQKVIFRYCQLKINFSNTSHFLPSLIWPSKKPSKISGLELGASDTPRELINLREINQREWENLRIYVSYFSIWKNLVKKELSSIQSLANLKERSQTVEVYAIIQDIQFKSNLVSLVLFDVCSTLKLSVSREFYQQNQAIFLVHQAALFHLAVRVENRKIQSLKIEKVEII